jgi:hypothetical protein
MFAGQYDPLWGEPRRALERKGYRVTASRNEAAVNTNIEHVFNRLAQN